MSAKSTNRPKYLVIYHQLKKEIINGNYEINECLPDGKTLAKTYGASVLTLNKALDILVAEGYIIKRRGDGTYIKDWKKAHENEFVPMSGTYSLYREHVTSKVLRFDIIKADEDLAEKLSIETGDFVYTVQRLRIIDEAPAIIESTHMPIALIPGLKMQHLEKSIYGYIKEELNLKIHSALLKIQGIWASKEEIELLGLPENGFVMQMEAISSLDDGKIFEYTVAKYKPEHFTYQTMIFNNEQ